MLNLISLWKNIAPKKLESEPLRHYSNDTKPSAIHFDMNTTQSSFEFENPPNVIFVKNIANLDAVDFYDDLPEITLTDEEETIHLNVINEQQVRDPHFYDGKQLIITGVAYDDSTNIVYVEASKVLYSFLFAFSNKRFPENSVLYQQNYFKTGVLAPLITRDEMTILLQRKDGLYSVPCGFLESNHEEKRLNFENTNLVVETAIDEITEEIAGINGSKNLRIQFSTPQITSMSFRQTASNSFGTIDFIAPSYVDCHSSYLQHVARNNLAKDAYEHTSQNELIPLDSQKRGTLLEKLLTGPISIPGAPMCLPIALSLTRMLNHNACMKLPRGIPNSSSVAWPLSFFIAKPEKPISSLGEELNNDTELFNNTKTKGCIIC